MFKKLKHIIQELWIANRKWPAKVLCFLMLVSILLSDKKILAQELNLSQFYEMPLLRNPALGGIFDCNLRVKSFFRNQWQSVTVPYQTSGISMEIKKNAGNNNWHDFGLQVVYDVAGDSRLKRIQLFPVYTLHLELMPENYLSLGFIPGFVNSQFDPTKLYWDDQFVNGQFLPTNPTQQVLTQTGKNYFTMAAGIMFTRPAGENGNFYIGASLYNANKPTVSFSSSNDPVKLERRWGLNGGVTVQSGANNAFTFYADAFMQGGNKQAMFGGFYTWSLVNQYYDDINKSSLHFGGIYRWNDAVIPTIKVDYGQFGFGFSYDVNISKLNTASQSRGGFELTMSYRNCAFGSGDNGIACPKLGRMF